MYYTAQLQCMYCMSMMIPDYPIGSTSATAVTTSTSLQATARLPSSSSYQTTDWYVFQILYIARVLCIDWIECDSPMDRVELHGWYRQNQSCHWYRSIESIKSDSPIGTNRAWYTPLALVSIQQSSLGHWYRSIESIKSDSPILYYRQSMIGQSWCILYRSYETILYVFSKVIGFFH